MNFLIKHKAKEVSQARKLIAWDFSLIHFSFPSSLSVTRSNPVNNSVMGTQERQAKSNTFMPNSLCCTGWMY